MDAKTRGAIKALERSLEEQLRDIAVTKVTINQLLAMSGEPPRFPEENDASNQDPRRCETSLWSIEATEQSARQAVAVRSRCGVVLKQREPLPLLERGGADLDDFPTQRNPSHFRRPSRRTDDAMFRTTLRTCRNSNRVVLENESKPKSTIETVDRSFS